MTSPNRQLTRRHIPQIAVLIFEAVISYDDNLVWDVKRGKYMYKAG
jgi:hypothetical protein